MAEIIANILNSGNAALLKFSGFVSNMTVTRNNIQIYNGPPILFYLDTDGLMDGLTYNYAAVDQSGNTATASIEIPTQQNLQFVNTELSKAIVGILKTGLDNLISSYECNVVHAGPIYSMQAMPIIAVWEAALKQTNVPIGQQTGAYELMETNGVYVVPTYVDRMFHIAIWAENPAQREEIRSATLSILINSLRQFFSEIGMNFSHDIKVASGQASKDHHAKVPMIFECHILFTVQGPLNVPIAINIQPIESITTQEYQGSEVVIDTQVPNQFVQ
jgi:hypothetical protein